MPPSFQESSQARDREPRPRPRTSPRLPSMRTSGSFDRVSSDPAPEPPTRESPRRTASQPSSNRQWVDAREAAVGGAGASLAEDRSAGELDLINAEEQAGPEARRHDPLTG
jgi:hypothetical protein